MSGTRPGAGAAAHDIRDRADIEELVVSFYTTAFEDPLIGRIFTEVAHMDLAAHLPIMCDFWESVLFRTGSYHRNAFGVHREIHDQEPLTRFHFSRWIMIWEATVDARFAGPLAERAKLQARRVAGSLLHRLGGQAPSDFFAPRGGGVGPVMLGLPAQDPR